jgi:CheY-like chemotaxis protein
MDKPIVLIVDGEALIRRSAVHMVEDAGFSALEASNADDAIRILEEHRDIRAVFTDINMPGSMDGLKLAHAIRDRWPLLHLIVASGLNMQDKLPVESRFLRKPYSAGQVTAALHDLFGYNPAPGSLEGTSCQRRVKRA